LFAVACELGAHLGGATTEQCQLYHEFGRFLGIAYQIYDDCIDLVGMEKDLGKSLGTDLQKGKLTLPVILLLQQAQPGEKQLVSSLLLNEHANSHALVVDFIRRYGTLQQAAQKARTLLRTAFTQIQLLPDNSGRSCLSSLISYLDSELNRIA